LHNFFARTGMKHARSSILRACQRWRSPISTLFPRCAASADPGTTRATDLSGSRDRASQAAAGQAASDAVGRKSEKLERQIEQLELRLEELNRKAQRARTQRTGSVTASATAVTKATRRALPIISATNTQTRAKETVCPECQGELRKLGEDVSSAGSTRPPASW